MTRAGPEINDSIRLTNLYKELAENVMRPFILTLLGLMSYASVDQRCVYVVCIDVHVCTVETLNGIKKC